MRVSDERLIELLLVTPVEEYGEWQDIIADLQDLRREIASHAPEGRNYTNAEYVACLNKLQDARKQLAERDAEIARLIRSNKDALGEAVAALYFADSSDYETQLWRVVDAIRKVPEENENEFIRDLYV